MEPTDGGDQYTEPLIRLPNLSICYDPLPVAGAATITRAEYGIKDEATIFLSSQTQHKYRPEYDAILAQIIRETGNAVLLLVNAPEPLVQRIGNAMEAQGVDPARCLRNTARLDWMRYLGVNKLSDVYLDTIGWSGGNTSLEALACGLPMVTLPGRTMRSRHTAAILSRLGDDWGIAADENDYVRRAVTLARIPALRIERRQHIEAHANRVFRDREAILGLDTFIIQAVRERC